MKSQPSRTNLFSSLTTTMLLIPNEIDDALIFLLEHLPPQMHLVIATRENPQFPLGRLRARGHLTELRATDLRFTPGEAATFLNQVMGLSLSADEITALEDPYRRLDCGASAGSALDAGARGHSCVHSGIRWRQSVHMWTIWSKRFCSVSLTMSGASYFRPPFSTGCMARCAMPSPARRKETRGWRPWSEAISLSFHWMTSATGIAIITSLPRFSLHI